MRELCKRRLKRNISTFCFIGSDRGIATSAGIWALWCWQENTHHVYPEGVVWEWGGEAEGGTHDLYCRGGSRRVNCSHLLLMQTHSKKKLEISSISSNHHIEINPRYDDPLPNVPARYNVLMASDAGIHDNVVVQELLKQVAQNQTLDAARKPFKGPCALSQYVSSSLYQTCTVLLVYDHPSLYA